MIRPLSAFTVAVAFVAGTSDSAADPRQPIFLTGYVVWPQSLGSAPIVGDPGDDVVTLRGFVPSASIGPASVSGAYRVLYVSRSAEVGQLHVEGLDARVTDACVRAHANRVVIRNTHCLMTGGPQAGGVNMPFGLDITSAADVLVEDSSFDGFRWRSEPDRYWNGDGVTIEDAVSAAQFRRVTANGNTDAGFDVRPYAVMTDVSASDNCRNFRFWSGGEVGTLTTGDSTKRGGVSACSGIWLNGSATGPRPTLHIRNLVVRMHRPGMIIEVETGPANIDIDRCDIHAPPGTSMIQFEKGAGEVRLGPGCTAPQFHS